MAIMISSMVNAANHLPMRIALQSARVQAVKTDPVFSEFRTQRQGKIITAIWSRNASPSNVSSFTLIRTYEDPTDPYSEWTVAGAVNCDSSRNYRLTDESVSPGFASYRIVASLANGGFAYSDIESVRIVQR